MEDSLRIKKGEINAKLIIFASRIMAAATEEELLAILKNVGAFVGRRIDFEIVGQEIKRQKAFASEAQKFDEMTTG